MKFRFGGYEILLSYIFEIPSISNEKPSISIGNFGLRSKNSVFQIINFEIPGFSLIEFETLSFSKKLWKYYEFQKHGQAYYTGDGSRKTVHSENANDFCFSASLILFKARTDCPVETILHRTRRISNGHQTKLFLKRIRISRVCVVLKIIWSYCSLINIKLR